MTFSAGKCSVRKNPSTALHENAPNKLLTAYATNPNHYTVIPTTFSKALLPFPTPTLPKPHYSLKIANTLASLVKGRWIDDKAQTVALLLSACDMPTLFIMQTFLPSRRRDCSAIFHSEPTLPKPHYPLKIANTLASPRKRGGGLTARHKPKFYSVFMGYIRLI